MTAKNPTPKQQKVLDLKTKLDADPTLKRADVLAAEGISVATYYSTLRDLGFTRGKNAPKKAATPKVVKPALPVEHKAQTLHIAPVQPVQESHVPKGMSVVMMVPTSELVSFFKGALL